MRLSDIEVDEVSLVDKAANNKKFAFLKRDNTAEKEAADKAAAAEAEKQAELNKATEIINNNDEPSAEEIAQIEDLSKQIIELTAQVNKN